MPVRFRKSFKVAPGVKVNVSKNGKSVTFGGKGAHVTVNDKGRTTTTVGVPGSGISYTQTTNSSSSPKTAKKSQKKKHNIFWWIFIGWWWRPLYWILIGWWWRLIHKNKEET